LVLTFQPFIFVYMNYRIKYDYGVLTNKETIVKNATNEMHAKIKLHTWLESKNGKAELRVFSCIVDYGINSDKDIMDFFGGIFK